jgi:hypothetical protein
MQFKQQIMKLVISLSIARTLAFSTRPRTLTCGRFAIVQSINLHNIKSRICLSVTNSLRWVDGCNGRRAIAKRCGAVMHDASEVIIYVHLIDLAMRIFFELVMKI